jgi:hypothetical protein
MLLKQSWAFCESPNGYYPYVTDCRQEWQSVPAKAPPAVAAQALPMWFYCDRSQGYFPYTPYCDGGWLPIPAMPPPAPVSDERTAQAD